MRPFRRSIVLPVLLVAVTTSACGSATGSTAVSVGGVDYSDSELRSDLADLIVDGTAPAEATTRWLDSWIFFTAIGLEMRDRGIVPTDAHAEAAVVELQGRDPAFDPAGSGGELRVHQWSLRIAALDWTATVYPDAAPVEPDPDNPPNMLCSNHILVDTEEQGLDVTARLDAGEEFAALAMELSLDTGSGALGGRLGCVAEGTFVAEFEAIAYPAEDGEVVGPVRSAFGFHVIEVVSAGPATAEEHPSADPAAIESAVASAASAAQAGAQADVETLRELLVDGLRAGAIIKFANSVTVSSEYGTWDPDQFLLIGPGGPSGAG